MSTYAERLRQAMDQSGVTVARLATQIGASYQGVKKVYDGIAQSGFNTLNNQRAAAVLGVSSDWLSTGAGDMQAGAVSPQAVRAQAELSPTAMDLAQLFDMLPDRISRAEAYSACSAIILKILRHPPGSGA